MHRRELLKVSALLLGSAISGTVSRAIMAGEVATPGASARIFNKTQQVTVNLLSDMIIPPTDTPGAVTAGVPNFIATIVGDWYTNEEREGFMVGFPALDQFTQDKEGKPFHQATEAIRIAALQDQERIASEYKPPAQGDLVAAAFGAKTYDPNTPFFKQLKELVVLGYYTSEVGATQELIYLPMPGYYDGNFDFSKVGRQWIN